jgi:hypothetical protein
MEETYLGDSYDLVKRFFCQVLSPVAPLYAFPKFVPASIRDSYTAATTIPIFGAEVVRRFGILLDPNTGVPLPSEVLDGATPGHASLQFIMKLNEQLHPEYMICFDQSYHRKHELDRNAQREAKRKFLSTCGLPSFYYVSHAPFLFTAQRIEILRSVLDRLISAGIPRCRFQPSELLA